MDVLSRPAVSHSTTLNELRVYSFETCLGGELGLREHMHAFAAGEDNPNTLGSEFSFDGNQIAITAPGSDIAMVCQRSNHVFSDCTTVAFRFLNQNDFGEDSNSRPAGSVSLRGDHLAIGAPNIAGVNRLEARSEFGGVNLYLHQDRFGWTQVSSVQGGRDFDEFEGLPELDPRLGWDVALSNNHLYAFGPGSESFSQFQQRDGYYLAQYCVSFTQINNR